MAQPHIKNTWRYWVKVFFVLTTLSIVAFTGSTILQNSKAATVNPYGYIDSCKLENNITAIYGWAADPNSRYLEQPNMNITIAGVTVVGKTNRAAYRDAAINKWIDKYRPGDPKPGTYGYRVEFSGLYRGESYTIKGVATNYGPGAGQYMTVNTQGPTDGNPANYFFAGGKVPDACLAAKPVASPPAPPPTQKPTPVIISPKPKPSPAPVAPPPPVISTDPAVSATAGSVTAKLTVVAGNAAKVKIIYGTSADVLDKTSEELPTNSDETTITLNKLAPLMTHFYQVIRTDASGRTAASQTADFKTQGFVIALRFVDNGNKPVKGIASSISTSKTRVFSDGKGKTEFRDVPEGNHTVTYTYKSQSRKVPVEASVGAATNNVESEAATLLLDYKINVEKVSATREAKASGSKLNPLFFIPVIVLLILGGVTWFVIRKIRAHNDSSTYPAYNVSTMPSTPGSADPLPPPPAPVTPTYPEVTPHMGESLKDLVLRSMAEEAKQRGNSDPPDKSSQQ